MATRAPSQVRLIFYSLPTTDRVIRIYKFTSCFRSTLLLLNPKAFNTHITLKFLTVKVEPDDYGEGAVETSFCFKDADFYS